MAIYAIGDLQGCFAPLQTLLQKIAFDQTRDELWFVGDLVNRGADSLACLRFVKSLGDRAVTVLGNHDLHLLCIAEGIIKAGGGDTLDDILQAPDRTALLDWLRQQKMMHAAHGYSMVHAGLLPQWSVAQAMALASEVEGALRADNYREFLRVMYGNQPDVWRDSLTGYERLRVITNAMSRLRFCTADGRMEFATKGEVASAPPGYMPWFTVPGRASADTPIICGHWSALGLRVEKNFIALDTGCLWGRALTAMRLEDRAVFTVSCAELQPVANQQ
jgi:bis(5'-nucleosyl)-tetraphosphatase (symmetrical)